MFRTVGGAGELGEWRGTGLRPSEQWGGGTEGLAQALHLSVQVVDVGAGAMAECIVLDLASTPAIAQRNARATVSWDALCPTIMMGDDRAIADVWVAGKPTA